MMTTSTSTSTSSNSSLRGPKTNAAPELGIGVVCLVRNGWLIFFERVGTFERPARVAKACEAAVEGSQQGAVLDPRPFDVLAKHFAGGQY
jgi:hypothetical protein